MGKEERHAAAASEMAEQIAASLRALPPSRSVVVIRLPTIGFGGDLGPGVMRGWGETIEAAESLSWHIDRWAVTHDVHATGMVMLRRN